MYRATEMDITMIGLQNAGKTSLLRVLSVCSLKIFYYYIYTNMSREVNLPQSKFQGNDAILILSGSANNCVLKFHSNSRIQYEESSKRTCNIEMVRTTNTFTYW